MMSRPAVHPVDVPPLMTNEGVAAVPRVRMKDFQGMPGTPGGLVLRLCQFGFAVISLCVMATTSDFPTVTAFSYLVAAVSLQSLWSLLLAIADIYSLLVRRNLRNVGVVCLFTIGDGVSKNISMPTVFVCCCVLEYIIGFFTYIKPYNFYSYFAAACASAGITVLVGNDVDKCNVNHCTRFMSATAMAFLSWFYSVSIIFLEFLVLGFPIGRA